MAAVHDDDLVIHHEIEVAAPFRVNLDQHRDDLDHVHAGRNRGADRDREVDVAGPRHVAANEHGLADLGALLAGQRHVAAGLIGAALGLAAAALTLLARLALLLPLRHLALLTLGLAGRRRRTALARI